MDKSTHIFLLLFCNDFITRYINNYINDCNFRTEKSSDQIIKPVNLEALNKWVGKIPPDVVRDMAKIAPMLRTLGYDPEANPPNYGKPDSKVADNTLHIQQNVAFWKEREEELLKHNKPQRPVMPGGPRPPGHDGPEPPFDGGI